MPHPLNRYQNWQEETNPSMRNYEREQYEIEEAYWAEIDRELGQDYFGDREKS